MFKCHSNHIDRVTRSNGALTVMAAYSELKSWQPSPTHIDIFDTKRRDDAVDEDLRSIAMPDNEHRSHAMSEAEKSSETSLIRRMTPGSAEVTVRRYLTLYNLRCPNGDRDSWVQHHHSIEDGSAAEVKGLLKRRTS